MKYFITILLSTLVIFLFHCCNGNELPIPKDEDIYLSKSRLSFENIDDSVKTIDVHTKGLFNLDKEPDWLYLQIDQQDKLIKVSVKPNYSREPREIQIKVFNEKSETYLHISQAGEVEESEPFTFKHFPVSEYISYNISVEGEKTFYNFKSKKLFVNPNIKNEIFLGNVLNYKVSDFPDLRTFEDYILNNVTVAADIIIEGKMYVEEWNIPSKFRLDEFANRVIIDIPKENRIYNAGEPISYRSYEYLHFLCMANLGLGVNELMLEELYPDKNMDKDIGLIYSYSQSLFSILIDPSFLQPRQETDLIKENHLSYINNISYGKTAFLTVESDGSKQSIDSIIKKVMLKEKLSNEEKILIDNMKICYLYFSADGALQKDNSTDNINKITKFYQMEKENIIPLNFSVLDYTTDGGKSVEYTFSMN